MRNKLKENADWYLNERSRKVYVRTRIENDVMKHLTSRFKKDFIKSFLIVEEIFDDLNRVFNDSNKRMTVLKTYKRLKRIEANKKFYTFWLEFQRLTSDSEIYDEEVLLKDFKDKIFWDLQRTLIFDIYKTNNLYEFARLYQFIDQTLRDVSTKLRNIVRNNYNKSIPKNTANNQELSREQSNISSSKS